MRYKIIIFAQDGKYVGKIMRRGLVKYESPLYDSYDRAMRQCRKVVDDPKSLLPKNQTTLDELCVW